MRPIFVKLLVGVLILLVLACLLDPWMIEVPAWLAFGWIAHATRVLPTMAINWGGVTLMIVAILLASVLAHGCATWLWRGLGKETSWRSRWTFTGMAVVLLMFVAGTAATGVVHQTGWLINSKERLTQDRRWEQVNRIRCASNMRQIGTLIKLYSMENWGRRPDSFETLVKYAAWAEFGTECFTCPSSAEEKAPGPTTRETVEQLLQGKPYVSFVYVPEGLTVANGEVVVMYEPLENHDMQGANLLFADGHVEFYSGDQFQKWVRPATTQPATLPSPSSSR